MNILVNIFKIIIPIIILFIVIQFDSFAEFINFLYYIFVTFYKKLLNFIKKMFKYN